MPGGCRSTSSFGRRIEKGAPQLLTVTSRRALIERPKMGFGIPIDAWLRGPLRGWAEELISERRLAGEGYFRPEPIRAAWDLHQSGRANMQYQLWAILMFQSWLDGQAAPEEAEGLAA